MQKLWTAAVWLAAHLQQPVRPPFGSLHNYGNPSGRRLARCTFTATRTAAV